jgi:hypothetical protein
MSWRSLEVPDPAWQEHRADTDGAGYWRVSTALLPMGPVRN